MIAEAELSEIQELIVARNWSQLREKWRRSPRMR